MLKSLDTHFKNHKIHDTERYLFLRSVRRNIKFLRRKILFLRRSIYFLRSAPEEHRISPEEHAIHPEEYYASPERSGEHRISSKRSGEVANKR